MAGTIVSCIALFVLKPCSTVITKTPSLSTAREVALMTRASAVMIAVLLLGAFPSGGATRTVKGRHERIDLKAGSCNFALTGVAVAHLVDAISVSVISAARKLTAPLTRAVCANMPGLSR